MEWDCPKGREQRSERQQVGQKRVSWNSLLFFQMPCNGAFAVTLLTRDAAFMHRRFFSTASRRNTAFRLPPGSGDTDRRASKCALCKLLLSSDWVKILSPLLGALPVPGQVLRSALDPRLRCAQLATGAPPSSSSLSCTPSLGKSCGTDHVTLSHRSLGSMSALLPHPRVGEQNCRALAHDERRKPGCLAQAAQLPDAVLVPSSPSNPPQACLLMPGRFSTSWKHSQTRTFSFAPPVAGLPCEEPSSQIRAATQSGYGQGMDTGAF